MSDVDNEETDTEIKEDAERNERSGRQKKRTKKRGTKWRSTSPSVQRRLTKTRLLYQDGGSPPRHSSHRSRRASGDSNGSGTKRTDDSSLGTSNTPTAQKESGQSSQQPTPAPSTALVIKEDSKPGTSEKRKKDGKKEKKQTGADTNVHQNSLSVQQTSDDNSVSSKKQQKKHQVMKGQNTGREAACTMEQPREQQAADNSRNVKKKKKKDQPTVPKTVSTTDLVSKTKAKPQQLDSKAHDNTASDIADTTSTSITQRKSMANQVDKKKVEQSSVQQSEGSVTGENDNNQTRVFNEDMLAGIDELSCNIAQIEREMQRQTSMHKVLEYIINKVDKSAEGLQKIHSNCQLVWKVSNFSKHLDQAIKGVTPVITSPQFASHLYGYNMIVSMCPCGDTGGFKQFISLANLAEGDYVKDDVLYIKVVVDIGQEC